MLASKIIVRCNVLVTIFISSLFTPLLLYFAYLSVSGQPAAFGAFLVLFAVAAFSIGRNLEFDGFNLTHRVLFVPLWKVDCSKATIRVLKKGSGYPVLEADDGRLVRSLSVGLFDAKNLNDLVDVIQAKWPESCES